MGLLRRSRLPTLWAGIVACGCASGIAAAAPDTAPAPRLLSASVRAMPGQGIAQQVRTLEMAELRAIGAPSAWQISRGRGVLVGVLDTGTDAGVPDLSGSVHTGPDFAAGADPAGFRPPHLHGTFIASLIAGHGSGPGRSEGVIGVAPAARVLAVRVILDDGEPGMSVYDTNPKYADAISRGIYYAVKHGVRVINMSLGAPDPTHDMRGAIAYAIAKGVVIVASAGNSGSAHGGFTPYGYPAAYTGVISVAALTPHSARASFSDRNSSVVVGAPGVSIVGAGPGGQYLEADGTSPAAAFVSGVVALIQSKYPNLSPALVQQALITTTKHRPKGGYNTSTGFGEVNAPAALAAAARLSHTTAGTGLASAARFGPASLGAVQVTHRDTALADGELAASAAGGLGFLVACGFIVVLIRRPRRGRRDAQAQPGFGPPGGPFGPAGGPAGPPGIATSPLGPAGGDPARPGGMTGTAPAGTGGYQPQGFGTPPGFDPSGQPGGTPAPRYGAPSNPEAPAFGRPPAEDPPYPYGAASGYGASSGYGNPPAYGNLPAYGASAGHGAPASNGAWPGGQGKQPPHQDDPPGRDDDFPDAGR